MKFEIILKEWTLVGFLEATENIYPGEKMFIADLNVWKYCVFNTITGQLTLKLYLNLVTHAFSFCLKIGKLPYTEIKGTEFVNPVLKIND
jgi:hypothetical protein